MKDFDYEVLQRKRLAQQARHKRNGSKSRKCSLPSDGLTHKQWKEKNGEVMTYNLSKPMDWETFKALPVDIQEEYLNKLINEHGANQERICYKMFRIGHRTFKTHLEKTGMAFRFSNAKRPERERRERYEAWQRFMAPEEEAAPEIEEAPLIEEAPPAAAPERRVAMSFDSFTLHFSGPFDREALCNSLAAIIQSGQRVKLEIKCEMEGG